MTMLWFSYVSGGQQRSHSCSCLELRAQYPQPPSRTFTQSFDLAFEVLTLNQIGDFVIVVLAALFPPPFLLLQALVTLR